MAFTEEQLRAIYRQSAAPTVSAPAFTEEQLRQIYRQKAQTQAEPEVSQLTYGGDQLTAADAAMGASQGYLRGLGKGAAFLPGLAANIPTYIGGKIAEQFGAPPVEKYPSEYLNELVDAGVTGIAGYDSRQQGSDTSKLLGKITEFGGSAIAPIAQLNAISNVKQLPTAVRTVSGFLSKDPGLQVRASGAAGVGSYVAEEAFPDSTVAQIALPVVAGGAYGIAEGAVKGGARAAANFYKNNLTSAGREKQAQDAAKEIIQRYVSDAQKAVKNIEISEQDIAKVPWIQKQSKDFLPQYRTTAEVAQDPGLALLQQTVRQTDPELNTQMIGLSDARDAARRNIIEKARGAFENTEEAGSAIRTALQDQYAGLKERVSKAAQKAFKGEDTIPVFKVKMAMSDAVEKFTKSGAKEIDPEFLTYLQNFNNFTAQNKNRIPLKELHEYYSTFGQFANGARSPTATTTQRITAGLASELRDNLDEAIISSSSNIPKSQKKALEQMIKLRRQQGATYETGVVAKMLDRKPFGAGFEMSDEAVAKAPIKTVDEMRQTLQALGNNTAGKQNVRAALIDDIWQRSTKLVQDSNGQVVEKISPVQFSNQLKKARSVITELNATQRKALLEIERDLLSESSVARNAYRAFERQSPTSPARTAVKEVQDAIARAAGIKDSNGVLGQLYNAVNKIVTNPEQQKLLINRELAKFAMNPRYAAQMMSAPTKKNVEGLAELLASSLVRSSAQSVRGAAQEVSQIEKNVGSTQLGRGAVGQSPARKNQAYQKASESLQSLGDREFGRGVSAQTYGAGASLSSLPALSEDNASTLIDRSQPQEGQQLNNPSLNRTSNQSANQYENYVKQIVEQQPPLIRAVIDVESSGRAGARSKAGAMGLMQVMPANLKKLGVADGTDPEKNIQAGTAILKEELERYKDLRLALAAYNIGSPKLNAAIKRAGSRNWVEVAKYLPAETRAYPSKVLARLNKYQNLA